MARDSEDQLFPALWLLTYTGIRRGEFLGLEWKNVDLESQKISITQSLIRSADRGLIIEPPKTRSSRRTIDIDDDTVRIMRQHKVAQAEDRIFLGPSYVDADLGFPNQLGNL